MRQSMTMEKLRKLFQSTPVVLESPRIEVKYSLVAEDDAPILRTKILDLAWKHQIPFVLLAFEMNDEAPVGAYQPKDVFFASEENEAISLREAIEGGGACRGYRLVHGAYEEWR